MPKLEKSEMKKLPAVKEAFQTLGLDTSIAAVRKAVKEKYGLLMTDAVAAKYFYQARKELRNGTPSVSPKKPGRKPSIVAIARPSGPGVDDVINAVQTLKGLTEKLGKANIGRLLEAL